MKKLMILHLLMITNSYVINNNPIILIPGLGANRLIKDKIDIWPPKLNYFLFNYREWEKNIMVENRNGNIIYDKTVKTLDFGDKKSLDLHSNLPFMINFYDNILDEYENMYPIPYDFRLIHSQTYRIIYYQKIQKYIESFNKPIILLTHSTGGLLAHNFLLNKSFKWRSKHIKTVINVNVPFGGTLISLNENIVDTNLNSIIGKKVIKSIGGLILNLPNNKYLNNILMVNGTNIDDYLSYFKLNDLKNLYDDNLEFILSLSKSTDIKTYIVYTSMMSTIESININNVTDIIEYKYGLGDGVVPLKSLLVPKIWNNKKVEFINLPDYEHSSIFLSKNLKKIINHVLSFTK